MSLERLWAGWRMPYVAGPEDGAGGGQAGPADAASPAGEDGERGESRCVFCRILASGEPDDVTHVVWRGERCVAMLNAYPYAAGHLLVMPRRHVADLASLEGAESAELWLALNQAVEALRGAYQPEGVNVGLNLGQAAGAGIPGHVHAHAVPRWAGDTNFLTTLAETRVLPEALGASGDRLRAAWPGAGGG